MRHVALTISLAAAVCGYSLIVAQDNPKQQPKRDTVEISERPDLAIDYAKVSRVKLASRKKSYHLGEMMSLDVALLNTSSVPIFFRKFDQPNFNVQDRQGKKVSLIPYIFVEAPTSVDSYVLLQPGEMVIRSFEVLAGCNKRASEDMTSGLNEKSSKRQFEENRFVNWGDSCLGVKGPGSYTIAVEQGNADVVVPANAANTKTAVGVVRSDMFTIQIFR